MQVSRHRPASAPAHERISRRSVIRTATAAILSVFSGTQTAIFEALSTESIPEKKRKLTQTELINAVLEELQLRGPFFCESTQEKTKADFSVEANAMLYNALGAIWNTGESFYKDPEKTSADVYHVLESSGDWLNTYACDTGEIQPEDYDCNDHRQQACAIWHGLGYQPYIVSTWPTKPQNRLDPDCPWHQQAALRIGKEKFIIVNGRNAIVWEGTIQAYIQEKQSSKRFHSSIIPFSGISEYQDCKYPYPINKLAVTALYSIGNEDQMVIEPVADE